MIRGISTLFLLLYKGVLLFEIFITKKNYFKISEDFDNFLKIS